jgi:hypothetical protein
MRKLTLLLLLLGVIPFSLNAQIIIEMYDGGGGSPASTVAPFEACVGDQVIIYWEGIPAIESQVSYLEFSLKDGSTFRVHDANPSLSPAITQIPVSLLPQPTLGCAAIPNPGPYCGSFNFTIPNDNGGAVSGPVILYDTTGGVLGTFSWIIRNPEVTISGLDPSTCSEDTVGISVSPAVSGPLGNGSFSFVQPNPLPFGTTNDYLLAPPYAPWTTTNNYARIFVPNPAGGGNVITGNNNASRTVEVQYTFVPTRSDGTACPTPITATDQSTVYANYDFALDFLAFPESMNPLETFINPNAGVESTEVPGANHPAWLAYVNGDPGYSVSFNGPDVEANNQDLDGALLGAGNSTNVIMSLDNNGCVSTGSGTVTVGAPSTNIPTEYCQNSLDTFFRSDVSNDPGSSYDLNVTCSPFPNAIVPLSTTPGNESFIFNTTGIPAGTVLTLTFTYSIEFNIFGSTVIIPGPSSSYQVSIISSGTAVPPPSFQSEYCHDDPLVDLSGFSPSPDTIWIRALTGAQAGTVVATLVPSGTLSFLPAAIHPNINTDTDYRLIITGGPCGTVDSFTFTINGVIEPYFLGRHADFTYCKNEPLDILQPFPLPSTADTAYFSGSNAVGPLGVFYPANTGNGLANFNVTYTYVSIYGCVSSHTENFTVNPTPTISLTSSNPTDEFCANDTVGYLTGIPVGGSYFGPTITNPADSIFEPDAVFNPTVPGVPGYIDYTYIYTDPTTTCTDTASLTVTVNPIPRPTFSIDPYFCESDQPYELIGSPNVAGTTQEYFFIFGGDTLWNNLYTPNPQYPNPLMTAVRVDTLIYEVADLTPCIGRDTQIVTVFPNPVHSFVGVNVFGDTTNQACLGQDTLTLSPNLISGTYDFTGPGVLFGSDQFVADVAGVGPHVLTSYFIDTVNAFISCRDTFVDTFFVHSTPNVAFSVDGGCGGVDIVFEPDNDLLDLDRYFFGTTNLYDSITTAVWDFGDGAVSNANFSIGPVRNEIDTAMHLYAAPGVYYTSLYVENRGYCFDSDTVRVVVLSTDSITADNPYDENFENSDGNWIEEAELGNQPSNIWEYGVANGLRIQTTNDPAHNKVWVTHLDERYRQNESGWVYSPCLDLTALERPMLKFDYFSDTDPGNDGVVIEYYDNATGEWLPLGDVDRGINWYNRNVIGGRPGVQDLAPRGWSGIETNWKTARYRLDNFMNYDAFRFRVAFGAVGVYDTTAIQLEGFAFDNVWIGERRRNVLFEHFSNESTGFPTSASVNNYVYNLAYATAAVKDVVLAQYNISFPNNDRFNDEYPDDPSARVSFYGLTLPFRGIVNGKGIGSNASASTSFTERDFEHEMLEDPAFEIRIDEFDTYGGNTLTVGATIKALKTLPNANYYLHFLVVEDSLSYFSGERLHSVVRHMVPDAVGTHYPRDWAIGDSASIGYTIPLDLTKIDTAQLELIAFVQTEGIGEKEVLQVVTSRDIRVFVNALGTDELEEDMEEADQLANMNLFPNPAVDQVNVEFDQAFSKDYNWRVVDLRGVELSNGQLQAGETQLQLNSYDWPAGMYFFVIGDQNFRIERKIVIKRP